MVGCTSCKLRSAALKSSVNPYLLHNVYFNETDIKDIFVQQNTDVYTHRNGQNKDDSDVGDAKTLMI